MHVYKCTVHQPKAVFLNPQDFKKPPNKVTKDNISFWKEGIEEGGSICKICYDLYAQRNNNQKQRLAISPNDIKVYI